MFITYLAEKISDESIIMVLDSTRRRVIKDESIVVEVVLLPIKLWQVFRALMKPRGA
jgi:hypothetical protein